MVLTRDSATINRAYASTITNPDEVKDKFYEKLNSLIRSAQSKLIINGDFNTHFGNGHQAWPR